MSSNPPTTDYAINTLTPVQNSVSVPIPGPISGKSNKITITFPNLPPNVTGFSVFIKGGGVGVGSTGPWFLVNPSIPGSPEEFPPMYDPHPWKTNLRDMARML